MIANPVKEAWNRGEPATGFNVFESLRPSVAKIAARAGFDFVMVDTEHVVHNEETLTNFLVIARDNGLAPWVTVVAPERALVSRMLDAGALGIVLSHADTAEQVEELVRWCKYAPAGERGLALGANAGYDSSDVAAYCEAANEAVLVIPKIESALRGREHRPHPRGRGWWTGSSSARGTWRRPWGFTASGSTPRCSPPWRR